MELGLTGRTALVTGASQGIGRAIAERLVAEGCTVWLVARNARMLSDRCDALAGDAGVAHSTGRAIALPADLTDEAERRRVVREVTAAGPLDILVNNAGAIPGGDLSALDDAAWKAGWELKVFGTISLSRHAYDTMKAAGRGVIVNIVGNAGDALDFHYICGSTGNAALHAFTKTLGSQSPRDGVRVVAVSPGPVATDRLTAIVRKKAEARTGSPERWRELLDALPFERPAKPEEIAAMVAMLASDHSAYTSGTVITIDGGMASQGRTV